MPCAKTHHHHQRFWSLHPPHPTVTATQAVGVAIPSLWPRVVATGGDWSIRVPHRGPLMGPRPVCREVSLVCLCECACSCVCVGVQWDIFGLFGKRVNFFFELQVYYIRFPQMKGKQGCLEEELLVLHYFLLHNPCFWYSAWLSLLHIE